jgi:two-component sensor histidine kinase
LPVQLSVAVIPGDPGKIVVSAQDLTERKRFEEHQALLINELNHRVKNTLATVQSIVSQSLRHAPSPGQARDAVESRLLALSRAHDVLTRENWEGANLAEVANEALAAHRSGRRVRISGPEVRVAPRVALALSMALQELATNAVKYGALSNEAGRVDLSWQIRSEEGVPTLRLVWRESGGPPVLPPERRGFGSRLIERSLAGDLAGDARITFERDGVVCEVVAGLG